MTDQNCLEAGCTEPVSLDSYRKHPLCHKHQRAVNIRVEQMLIASYREDVADLMADARKLRAFGNREHEMRTRVGQARMTNHEMMRRRQNLRRLEATP